MKLICAICGWRATISPSYWYKGNRLRCDRCQATMIPYVDPEN